MATTVSWDWVGPLLERATWTGAVEGSFLVDWNVDLQPARTCVVVDGPVTCDAEPTAVDFTYDLDGLLTGAGALALARDEQTGLLTTATLGAVTTTWTPNGFGEVAQVEHCWSGGAEPDFAVAYGWIGVFCELLAAPPELERLTDLLAGAEDEYMPQGPPTSPLTASHFWSWAFFDAAMGVERETIGTCVLALADVVPMHAEFLRLVRLAQDSRLGIYVHAGHDGRCVPQRELVTDQRCTALVPAGYRSIDLPGRTPTLPDSAPGSPEPRPAPRQTKARVPHVPPRFTRSEVGEDGPA